MSLSRDLVDGTIAAIDAANPLTTQLDEPLVSAMDGSSVGAHRLLAGDGISLVYVGMTVEAFGLDSHMLFAFTAPDSAVPHFTLDSVLAGPHYAFHLDLIPRVDPGANLAYLDHCFAPLDEAHAAAAEIDGLTPAHLAPRQWQLMSAWMLAHRADADAFASINPLVDAYRDHWLGLVESGVPDGVVPEGTDLAARDDANRAAIFNPAVDPVWGRVDQLLGPDVSTRIQVSLRMAGRDEAL
ncbi:MAG: hypothetical protein ACR2O6_14580 [Ilumatobacteraceae bacterium]